MKGGDTHVHASSASSSSSSPTTRGAPPTSSSSSSSSTSSPSSPSSSDSPPFVILVDVDGTIIGDIDAQLVEYQLVIQGPSKKRSQANAASLRGRMFREQLVAQLMNGLMRPGFSAFCAQCHMLGVPVILYTAAEHEWATFLAPCILQAVRLEMARDLENPELFKGFKFARLFTRRYCTLRRDGSCVKTLAGVGKDLLKTLRKHHKLSDGLEPLLKRALLIDNTPGVLKESAQLVAVPTYGFAYPYDVTMNIDHTDSSRVTRARGHLLSDASFLRPPTPRERESLDTLGGFRAWLYRAVADAIHGNAKKHDAARRHDPLWRTLRARLVANVHKARTGTELASALAGNSAVSSSISASASEPPRSETGRTRGGMSGQLGGPGARHAPQGRGRVPEGKSGLGTGPLELGQVGGAGHEGGAVRRRGTGPVADVPEACAPPRDLHRTSQLLPPPSCSFKVSVGFRSAGDT